MRLCYLLKSWTDVTVNIANVIVQYRYKFKFARSPLWQSIGRCFRYTAMLIAQRNYTITRPGLPDNKCMTDYLNTE